MIFEEEVLRVLANHPEGLYASDFSYLMPSRWFLTLRLRPVLKTLVGEELVRKEIEPNTGPRYFLSEQYRWFSSDTQPPPLSTE